MTESAVTQVVMDANTMTAIINNVNSMYSNVIAYTVGLVAFVGILLPVAVSFFQNRQLKINHQALTDKIAMEMQEARNALIADLKNQLAIELSNFDKKASDIKNELNENILKASSGLNAKAHHLQARVAISANDFTSACIDCLVAINDYSKAADEGNLQVVLSAILFPLVLPKLKQADFENDDKIESYFQEALASIGKINTNGRYNQNIQLLKTEFKTAKARKS